MRVRVRVGRREGFFSIKKKLVFGDAWKQNNFPFSRMNIFFFLLVVRLEIWDGMGGTAENAEILLFIGGFLFLFSS